MSGNLSGFNAADVEPNSAFTPLPAGEYQAIISESEMKPTKDGQAKYLELKLQILNGQHQNRTLFDRLNLVNKNDVAVQIAKGTLSSICRAVGVLTPNDSAELHNKPMGIVVKIRNDQNGNPQNEVKGYKPRHTTAPAASIVEQAFESDGAEAVKSPF
jgi:hypothetical protein